MESVLQKYLEQVEKDKQRENNELAEVNDEIYGSLSKNISKDEYVKRLNELRNDPNDMANKFHNEYKKITNKELEENGLLKKQTVEATITRVYCPKCGEELKLVSKARINPYTGEKIAMHKCKCGFKANLDNQYPNISYVDENNNVIEIPIL